MTVLYKLSREQLSKQYHYDFGLRALKSVLVMAGGLKRRYGDMPEDLVLMRALRDSNMPKFVYEDVPLFMGLIEDLFPNMDCPRVGYECLKEEVKKELEAGGFRCSSDHIFTNQVRRTTFVLRTWEERGTLSSGLYLDFAFRGDWVVNRRRAYFSCEPITPRLHPLLGSKDFIKWCLS